VVVAANDRTPRVGLAEQHRRRPETAADVGDPRPGRQLLRDVLQRGDPVRHQLGDVAGPVERVAPDEDVIVVLVPADSLPGPERLGDARFGAQVAEHREARCGQVRAVRVGEAEGLLGGERELARRGVVGDVPGGGLPAQPLGEVAQVASGPLGELLRRRGTVGEGAVEAEPAADDDGTGSAGRTEVADEPAEEGGQRVVVQVPVLRHADQGRAAAVSWILRALSAR
jgi:hypothetical protein